MRDGLPSGFNIKLADVVREANRTTGAAYQIWSSQDEYRLELATYMARSVSYAGAGIAESALAAAMAADVNLWSVVEATGRAYLEHLVNRPEFYLSLHFWATADNLPAEVASAVEEGYASVQSTFEAFFGAVLDQFDVAVVPPHTIGDLTMAATAITEGTALRHRFTRNEANRKEIGDRYVSMLFSTLMLMTTATTPYGV